MIHASLAATGLISSARSSPGADQDIVTRRMNETLFLGWKEFIANYTVNAPTFRLPSRPRPNAAGLSLDGRYKVLLERAYTAWRNAYRRANAESTDDSLSALDFRGQIWAANSHRQACAPFSKENVHSDLRFLAWHRAFVWSHERALISLLLEDSQVRREEAESFRIPYWGWDTELKIPALYQSGALGDEVRNQKLEWSDLGRSDTSFVAILRAAGAWRNFVGTADAPSSVANQVHNDIHRALGKRMVNWATTALDPIFYAHHGNLDRLWRDFIHLRDPNQDKDLVNSLQTTYVVVPNPTSQCKRDRFLRFKIWALLDEKALGYSYEAPYTVLDANPKSSYRTSLVSGINPYVASEKPLPVIQSTRALQLRVLHIKGNVEMAPAGGRFLLIAIASKGQFSTAKMIELGVLTFLDHSSQGGVHSSHPKQQQFSVSFLLEKSRYGPLAQSKSLQFLLVSRRGRRWRDGISIAVTDSAIEWGE